MKSQEYNYKHLNEAFDQFKDKDAYCILSLATNKEGLVFTIPTDTDKKLLITHLENITEYLKTTTT